MATPAIYAHLSQKSRVRVWVSPIASLILCPWILVFLLLVISTTSAAAAKIPYSDHCSSTVPESVPIAASPLSIRIRLFNGYVSGGDEALVGGPDRSFSFYSRSVRQTETPGVLQVAGVLLFNGVRRRRLAGSRSLLHLLRPRSPRSFTPSGMTSFNFSGFWSEPMGVLCMVGSGSWQAKEGTLLDLSAVFKLNYPNIANISSSLVSGTVQVLDAEGRSNRFDPISVLVYAQKDYEYTLIHKVNELCSSVNVEEKSLGFENGSLCSNVGEFLQVPFRLDYERNCSDRHCGPFFRSLANSPAWMFLTEIQCSEDEKLRMHIGFSNVSELGYHRFLVPERALIGEGIWDRERNRLCLVTCRVHSNATVDDCTIGFCLWFPEVLTLKSRSTVVGIIWSSRNESDSSYFDMVSFRSSGDIKKIVPGLKYNYTKTDDVLKHCAPDYHRKVGKKRYPDGKSIVDMRFNLFARASSRTLGSSGWGSATPVSIGQAFYGDSSLPVLTSNVSKPALIEMTYNILNVSYEIVYEVRDANLDLNGPTKISAEGIYDAGTGILCMMGCKYGSSLAVKKRAKGVEFEDCQILINAQLPPYNPGDGEHLKGTIQSTREKLDPLFFDPVEILSYGMYRTQAAQSLHRIDIEIAMVLISQTLLCIFVGLQLFHLKKHSDVVPSVSITMLTALILGHMIPLVLNYETLTSKPHNKRRNLLWSGEWLEVNEILIRGLGLVVFLLHLRLLQVTWSSRSADEGKKGFWDAERRAVFFCSFLWFAGGLIAWFVQSRSLKTERQRPILVSGHNYSLLEEMTTYAGFILDVFLFPQVILNVFLKSRNKALTPSFYVGVTFIRALPHVYDAYRACHYVLRFKRSYIYASPDGNFYSYAWDIIIPCQGMVFAVLIYVQQRYGGTCFLPLKNKQPGGYETVSVAST